MAGWLAGWLVAGCWMLVGWLVGWLLDAGCWMAGWLQDLETDFDKKRLQKKRSPLVLAQIALNDMMLDLDFFTKK